MGSINATCETRQAGGGGGGALQQTGQGLPEAFPPYMLWLTSRGKDARNN